MFENLADSGPLTLDLLPELSRFEEMLIARVGSIVEYKCSGHIGSFICNTGRIYDELPFFSKAVDILFLWPVRRTILVYSISSAARKTPSGDGCSLGEVTIQVCQLLLPPNCLYLRSDLLPPLPYCILFFRLFVLALV